MIFLSILIIFCNLCTYVSAFDWRIKDSNHEFVFGDEPAKYAIYRLIGNDMPPLQTRGQLRWNTKYALDNEPNFPGVHKKWILNRIWNDTEYSLLYADLINAGVKHRDIISRCLNLDTYSSFTTKEEKLFYLTAQNEGRNAGIIDGRESGYEWSVILDGNTFISGDSWASMQAALEKASEKKMVYLKIPYHRVHSIQNTTWLNRNTHMSDIINFAPTKGESQVAFHRDAKELFTLGDTNAAAKDSTKRKGYGQRNKSYMFKEGQICGPGSKVCGCADVFEGNEEDAKDVKLSTDYTKQCGLVLRLWNYPTDAVIYTGLTREEEEGLFCYLQDNRDNIKHVYTECQLVDRAIELWKELTDVQRKQYRGKRAQVCKDDYHNIFLTESCFRSRDREIAQNDTAHAIEQIIKTKTSTSGDKAKLLKAGSLCHRIRPPSSDPSRHHFLTVFDKATMDFERSEWDKRTSNLYHDLDPYLQVLVAKAKASLKSGSFSVTSKSRLPPKVTDKRFYFSPRPFHWDIKDLPSPQQYLVKKGKLETDEFGQVKLEGEMCPGSVVGDEGASFYDLSTSFYMMDNVTTLALAWYYTRESTYAQAAVKIVDTFFLDEKTGMLPTLQYAQNGEHSGIIEWKDIYFLIDAFTMLEESAVLSSSQVLKLQRWCTKLAVWLSSSQMGREEGRAFNHRGLYYDLITLSLATYAQDDNIADDARYRLAFRLSKTAPVGHFGLDGSQPNEVIRQDALHLMTLNLAGWIHAALLNEAISANDFLPRSMKSLWLVKHDAEKNDPKAKPVLLKAIRYLTQFLPVDAKNYGKVWKAGFKAPAMTTKFPFGQSDDFNFDRMLEIIRNGIQVYGMNAVMGGSKLSEAPPSVQAAISYPLYSTEISVLSARSSIPPSSGLRPWSALGLFVNRTKTV